MQYTTNPRASCNKSSCHEDEGRAKIDVDVATQNARESLITGKTRPR